MDRGLIIHIEAGSEKHTEVLTRDHIRIGSCSDCDLRLNTSEVTATASVLLLELSRKNGHYHVSRFDNTVSITHNGGPLAAGAVIEDGDQVLIGTNDVLLQFFPLGAPPVASLGNRRREAQLTPFIEQAAVEAMASLRRDDAKVFLREFTRELVREINTSTKVILLAIAIVLVTGVLYLGFAVFNELHRSRQVIDQQNQQLVRLGQEVDVSKEQFTKLAKSNKDLIESTSLAPRLWSQYSNGVCLISGTYIFVEPGTNKPLRYPEAKSNENESGSQEQRAPLTPEGHGAIAQFDFVGTGFHVGDGYVLTNRHVAAQPWLADDRAMSLSGTTNGKPRMIRLLAFFPGHPQPFVLRLKDSSQHDDLAVCQLEQQEQMPQIPELPLDHDSDAAAVGKSVVMMGYPSGPERILASLPEEESMSIQQRFGSSLEGLLTQLSARGLIKPLTTQGHITDLDLHRIIYDARTAEGGSGAPLFGQSGRVIAVNFAVFTGLQDSNFAVPIRYGATLLQRAGWKPSELPGESVQPPVTSGQKESRASAAASG